MLLRKIKMHTHNATLHVTHKVNKCIENITILAREENESRMF